MRVLITGVTGFIGNALSKRLVELGYDVLGIVRFTSTRPNVPSGVNYVYADLTDYFSLVKVVQSYKPEIVIHLGALTPVSESFHQPRAYMEINLMGTINLVEAIKKHSFENLRLFVMALTTELYNTLKPIDESTPFNPMSPYAVSKVACYYYLNYMYNVYKFPVIYAIPCNTYGRANVKQKHFVIEKIITSMLEGKKVIELGSPDVERDFMFREDHVNAYISIIKNVVDYGKIDIIGQKFVFGTGKSYKIREIFELCKKLIGWEGEVRWNVYLRPYDQLRIVTNPRKAREVLGWEAKYNIENGLKKAIEEWREVLQLK